MRSSGRCVDAFLPDKAVAVCASRGAPLGLAGAWLLLVICPPSSFQTFIRRGSVKYYDRSHLSPASVAS